MKRELKTDLLIVGGGIGGMAAALSGRECGCQDILILEQRGRLGGNGNAAHAFPLPYPDGTIKLACQDDRKVFPDDPRISTDKQMRTDAIFQSAMDWCHWRADPRLVRALVDKSDETAEWIVSRITPEQIEEFQDRFKPGQFARFLASNIEKENIPVMYNTSAKHLLCDENGRVTGVEAEGENGKKLTIFAKCVVVSTGGFYGNQKLMAKYFYNYADDIYTKIVPGGILADGSGIEMAIEVGAATETTACFEVVKGYPFRFSAEEAVHVDKNGERFCDESKSQAKHAVFRLPDLAHYIIMDQKIADFVCSEKPVNADEVSYWNEQLRDRGIEINTKNLFDFFRGAKREDQMLKAGRLVKVDTLAEAAAFIGCDAETLQTTINRYNVFCKKGHDDDFCKNKNYLMAIDTPPYYVYYAKLGAAVTHGPICVNKNMELLAKSGKAIPGCYYCGVNIGGTCSDTYTACVPSRSICWAFASGRIAGEKAANQIDTQKELALHQEN